MQPTEEEKFPSVEEAPDSSAQVAISAGDNQQEFMGSEQSSRAPMGSRSQMSGMQQSANAMVVGGGADSKAAMDEYKRKMKERTEQENANLWQHPFVDVFKHFKVMPGSDWKLNKRQGEVNEYFAREIGRRALAIEGTISANNFVQAPHPQGATKALGLTGRYCYLQVKCPRHGLAFSYHLDLGMAERSHGIRISVSNLFKNFGTSNGFVAQLPLELKSNQWTIVVLDLYEILRLSQLLPATYLIEGSYQVRSVTMCANSHVRGVFTSDNMYDHVTLPADMRFKFAFDLSKWSEYFDWQMLPQDWSKRRGPDGRLIGDENRNLTGLVNDQRRMMTTEQERQLMRQEMRAEIDEIIQTGKQVVEDKSETKDDSEDVRRQKYEDMQRKLNMQFKQGPGDAPVSGYQLRDDDAVERASRNVSAGDYKAGMFSGYEGPGRSHKLDKDPILELQHIIGYQAEKCTQVKWARCEGENVVLFSTGGALIAMDTDTSEQKRFFFGHSAPISCFDVSRLGNMLASAQEGVSKKNDENGKGKPAMIRLWDYASARLLTAIIMPVIEMKQMHFSHDGRYLACVGLDAHNKELIWVWDVAEVPHGEKPQVVTKKTSEFNILDLKFSPIDPTRLASCGKENIRLWRISDTKSGMVNIRGSAVVLNHHARDTVFTCLDFEHGFRVADQRESEGYMRLFVGTKHGMVFIVNYQDETVEATYKTNDAAIYSICVNEAFCVVGSMDSYVRSWPLDFNDFHIEAQHEGVVSSVDISNDGLKVACGTMFGSIGILDKSNQGYKTLLRSHTDEIIAVDYHLLKNQLISVSTDKTIRLWDLSTYEEVYEFSSPIDQPIAVSAHPNQSIFACGFSSGKMRIFDIESTEVLDEFSQFNTPLESLAYDAMGRFLIACSKDGQVSIHNAARQHLPIKMMRLQHAPEFVHVAFTAPLPNDNDPIRHCKFAVMGENGNNIICYETESFLIQHWVQVGQVVKSFKFANQNKDLVVVTKDCRVRIYGISRYEGVFLREVTNCHRGLLTALDVTSNAGYFLTGGDDTLVKIWDYEAQRTTSFNYQSFIGHTYKLNAVMFNPRNQNQIISVGARDGIYFWDFNGDVDNDYSMPMHAGMDVDTINTEIKQNKSMLQEMRTRGKAPKEFRNQMAEDSFYLTEFSTVAPSSDASRQPLFNDTSMAAPVVVKQTRDSLGLTYNHYVYDVSKKFKVETDNVQLFGDSLNQQRHADTLPQKLVNGYDGFGGVHDNLIWDATGGKTYFTLNNKLIVESTHDSRKQQCYAKSSVQLSCMAVAEDHAGQVHRIAVGEGSASGEERVKYNAAGQKINEEEGNSVIYIYMVDRAGLGQTSLQRSSTEQHDTTSLACTFSLKFHQRGVQSLSFSNGGRFLVSLGVRDDNMVAVWDAEQGSIVSYTHVSGGAHNQVTMSNYMIQDDMLKFTTVGNNAKMTLWQCNVGEGNSNELEAQDILVGEDFKDIHFCSVAYTNYSQSIEHDFRQYIVVGCSDGSLAIYDPAELKFVAPPGRRAVRGDAEVGCISIKSGSIVHVTSKGHIIRQAIDNKGQFTDPVNVIDDKVELGFQPGAIISLSMDSENRQGLIGTETGQIWYVDFDQQNEIPPVRLISSCNKNQDAISMINMDSNNSKVFLAGGGTHSDDIKMYAHENMDQVHDFKFNLDEDGHVVFITDCVKGQKKGRSKGYAGQTLKIVGFSKGMIRIANLDRLEFIPKCSFKLDLQEGEKITAGHYAYNDHNFLVGTNYSNLYICSLTITPKKKGEMTFCQIYNVGKVNKQSDDPCPTTLKMKTHQRGESGVNDFLPDEQYEPEPAHSDRFYYNDMVGITCIKTPSNDPIGTLLIGFDDGAVRIWQSQMNDNIKSLLIHKAPRGNLSKQTTNIAEMMEANKTPLYDISRYGYQQFDKYDEFKLPDHAGGDINFSEDDSKNIKGLYQNKKYPTLQAVFPPGQKDQQCYFAIVENIQFVFIREFKTQSPGKESTRRIPISTFPTSMCLVEFAKIELKAGAKVADGMMTGQKKAKSSNYLIAIGCKDGKTLIYKLQLSLFANQFMHPIYVTRGGISYGAITAIDIQKSGETAENMICSTESGELLQYKLLEKLNEEEM